VSYARGSEKAEERHQTRFDEVDGEFSSPLGVGLRDTCKNFDMDLKTRSFD